MEKIKLTPSQQKVFDQLKAFVNERGQRFFILRGYAGTGKTTLIRFLIKDLQKRGIAFQLLASTGRAAKVMDDKVLDDRFSARNITKHATTIHSMIYKFTGLNRDVSEQELTAKDANGQLLLTFFATKCENEEPQQTIYIVDEASMISDRPEINATQAKFGSGRLLSELISYDDFPDSKYIFFGDPCQLPPVGDTKSPALDPDFFRPRATMAQLTEIIRQAEDSDIISISKQVRKRIDLLPEDESQYGFQRVWGKLPFANSKNFVGHVSLDDMVNTYAANVRSKGYNDSIFICRSNKMANEISMTTRDMLLHPNSRYPIANDLLLVIQNNYPTDLVNGDMVEVVSCSSNIETRAGLHFANAVVKEIGSGTQRECLLLLDTLVNLQLNLNTQQQTALFLDFIYRMKEKGIKQKHPLFNEMLIKDKYLNALRCTYGYAVTCHKSQGGEWNHVFLQMPRNITLNPTRQNFQWIYTAITRAREKVHYVRDFYIEPFNHR